MRGKPKVCVIDEDLQVKLGWESALNIEADLYYYHDHEALYAVMAEQPELVGSFDCVIIGRYFRDNTLDIFDTDVAETLRTQGVGAIFLNWQGYLTKEEIGAKFEGRLFNRYGVRWQTLRTRIQKIKSKKGPGKKILPRLESPHLREVQPTSQQHQLHNQSLGIKNALYLSKPERCQELLKQMARHAGGRHRERLEYYAQHDQKTGIELLEAIYNRLLTVKESTHNCPSRYINSSPVVAKNILQKALYG